jgi:7,8-dihydroneopterin aldolase/epimerase/oxygenase
MLTVHLSNLSFHAFHGVYEEETKLGNDFEVNVLVKYEESNVALDNLSNLVNYEVIFEIVKKRMAIPSPLLEEVAEAMVRKIKHQYKQLKEIAVSIHKLQPPIPGLTGKVGITLHKIFED